MAANIFKIALLPVGKLNTELKKEKREKTTQKVIANINITESYKFQKHLLFTRQLNPSFKALKEP